MAEAKGITPPITPEVTEEVKAATAEVVEKILPQKGAQLVSLRETVSSESFDDKRVLSVAGDCCLLVILVLTEPGLLGPGSSYGSCVGPLYASCSECVPINRRGSKESRPTMGKEEVERDGEGGKRGRSRDHSRRGDKGQHRADRGRSEGRGQRGPF